MGVVWGGALAAAVFAASAGGRVADGGTCELARVDRRTTSSLSCLACHDGTGGPGVEYRAEFEMGEPGRSMSHPVHVDYRAVAARQPDRYRPATALPPEVPLVAGRVECTTCHDGGSPDRQHVARVADLCQACHQL